MLDSGGGEATNIHLVNLMVSKYFRAVVFQGGADVDTAWNGFNVIHRSYFYNIGTRYRSDITPEVWSPGIFILKNSRSNKIWQNRVEDSSNRMDHTNGWFHTVYASHGAIQNSVQYNDIVNTSGDFHIRDKSDRNTFANNVITDSFYWALVTDWHSETESESLETEISGNIWHGDWYCELNQEVFHREHLTPDSSAAPTNPLDFVVRTPNQYLPAAESCVPY